MNETSLQVHPDIGHVAALDSASILADYCPPKATHQAEPQHQPSLQGSTHMDSIRGTALSGTTLVGSNEGRS